MEKARPGRGSPPVGVRPKRRGVSLVELLELFPDDRAAEAWFESRRWASGIYCPDCGSSRYSNIRDRKPMPYRCRDCRSYFSVRKGTTMQSSKLGYQTWALAIHLVATSVKGVSSMKLHRDLKISQPSAWYLAQRIREGFGEIIEKMGGPAEVDETFVGGKEKNKHRSKRLRRGRGTVGKIVVVGVKDRPSNRVWAEVVAGTDAKTLQGFVRSRVEAGARIYTDEHSAYEGLPNHQAVRHSVGEYVRDDAHTNGLEAFWSLFKRGYHGTFHYLSRKHLNRYLREFAGRYNMRSLDTLDVMSAIARGLEGKRLRYRDLTADS